MNHQTPRTTQSELISNAHLCVLVNLHVFVKHRARLFPKELPCSGKRTERLMTRVRRYPMFECAVETLEI